jgi:carbon-monoxide dehydrogenase large subunit
MTAATGIGARVLRTEDKRFLTGTGRYVDDLPLARDLRLRSPHARQINIDIAAARRCRASSRSSPARIWSTPRSAACLRLGGQDKHGHRTSRRPSDHGRRRCATSATRWRWRGGQQPRRAKDAAGSIKVDYDVKAANVDLAHALDKEIAPRSRRSAGQPDYDWKSA